MKVVNLGLVLGLMAMIALSGCGGSMDKTLETRVPAPGIAVEAVEEEELTPRDCFALHYRILSSDDVLKEDTAARTVELIKARLEVLGIANGSVIQREDSLDVRFAFFEAEEIERVKGALAVRGTFELQLVDDAGSVQFFGGLAKQLGEESPIVLREETLHVSDSQDTPIANYLLVEEDLGDQNGRDLLAARIRQGSVPSDRVVALERLRQSDAYGNPTGTLAWRTYFLYFSASIKEHQIERATLERNETTGAPFARLTLNETGKQKVAELTAANIGRRLAFVVDGKINSVPYIAEEIPGGVISLSLHSYASYAKMTRDVLSLVVAFRSGVLPASLELIDETEIAPSQCGLREVEDDHGDDWED